MKLTHRHPQRGRTCAGRERCEPVPADGIAHHLQAADRAGADDGRAADLGHVVKNFDGLSSYGMIPSEMDKAVRRRDRGDVVYTKKKAVIEDADGGLNG